MAVRGGPNWSWLEAAARTPPVTLDMYADIPEDLSRTIEVVDGMVLTEVPFRFRRPDVVVYRFLPEDRRGRWRGKPYALDVLIAVEIVSRISWTNGSSALASQGPSVTQVTTVPPAAIG